MRWSSGRLRVLISALLKEKEQEGALGQRNIVTLDGVLNDFDSVAAVVSTVVKLLFPKRSLLASNSIFSLVSVSLEISSLFTYKRCFG